MIRTFWVKMGLWMGIFFWPGQVFAQPFLFNHAPLTKVINEVETQTSYRFLYREALITGVNVSFSGNNENWPAKLDSVLQPYDIGVKTDTLRKQVLLYTLITQTVKKDIYIDGYVLDAQTGERLPYSTIVWKEHGALKGVAGNPDGSFSVSIRSNVQNLVFLVSFVGYKSKNFELDFTHKTNWNDISIRLQPEPYSSKEILIRGVNYYTVSDTVLDGLIKMGTFSPLGESNNVRSLQLLPSVNLSTALNNGINIRGSSSDGFRVLLDGQNIYHQSHLFGLLDAMNSDILLTSGFYYDITPAQFQAPLGGTLSLITKTGSLNRMSGSAGISNTAGKISLDGPIKKGKASWLFSARHSYIDQINWMGNEDLIKFGLDVNRPADTYLASQNSRSIKDIRLGEYTINQTEAKFYDLHGKVYMEAKNGNRLSVSGYAGHDFASQNYSSFLEMASDSFQTKNKWNHKMISATFNSRLGKRTFSDTQIGITGFNSLYFKEDFNYQIIVNPGNREQDSSMIAPLRLKNDLTQFDFRQSFYTNFEGFSTTYGISYSDFDLTYNETSLSQNSFRSQRTSQLVDVFHQVDVDAIPDVKLHLGNRVHYFSNGKYVRWSPRAKVQLFPDNTISLGLGFSRNYQFLHRLQFYNINSSDFWILTNKDQPPSSVNFYSAGIQMRLHEMLYIQIEGYLKDYKNLRIHELNTSLISSTYQDDDIPWFYDNDGLGKGLEFLIKNHFNRLIITTTYTLSSMKLKNDKLNQGEEFYAEWDRTHQFSLNTELNITKGLNTYLSWMYASGTPDRLNPLQVQNNSRLGDYSRVDASLSYTYIHQNNTVKAMFSVFNLFDRENPWYSERQTATITLRSGTERQTSVRTQIYDLGIQPSFSLSVSF